MNVGEAACSNKFPPFLHQPQQMALMIQTVKKDAILNIRCKIRDIPMVAQLVQPCRRMCTGRKSQIKASPHQVPVFSRIPPAHSSPSPTSARPQLRRSASWDPIRDASRQAPNLTFSSPDHQYGVPTHRSPPNSLRGLPGRSGLLLHRKRKKRKSLS